MLVCAAGFHMGGCGDSSIRFRPALIFQPSHVNMFLEGFQQVLNELNGSSHLKEAVKQWYHFFFGQLQLTSHIDTLHGVKITTVTNIILHCKLMLIYYWHLEVKIDSYHIASYNHSSSCGRVTLHALKSFGGIQRAIQAAIIRVSSIIVPKPNQLHAWCKCWHGSSTAPLNQMLSS